MRKKDWIILRLLMAGARTPAVAKPDFQRAIIYLLKKHGAKTLYQSIEQLHAGEQS
jgi:hypothetical protein